MHQDAAGVQVPQVLGPPPVVLLLLQSRIQEGAQSLPKGSDSLRVGGDAGAAATGGLALLAQHFVSDGLCQGLGAAQAGKGVASAVARSGLG